MTLTAEHSSRRPHRHSRAFGRRGRRAIRDAAGRGGLGARSSGARIHRAARSAAVQLAGADECRCSRTGRRCHCPERHGRACGRCTPMRRRRGGACRCNACTDSARTCTAPPTDNTAATPSNTAPSSACSATPSNSAAQSASAAPPTPPDGFQHRARGTNAAATASSPNRQRALRRRRRARAAASPARRVQSPRTTRARSQHSPSTNPRTPQLHGARGRHALLDCRADLRWRSQDAPPCAGGDLSRQPHRLPRQHEPALLRQRAEAAR